MPPPPPLPRIFVSVASYRDPEAPHTLHSLFAHAAAPERVFVGVCFQCELASDEDADCVDLSGLRPEWAANVRTMHVPWREARGPVWARFLVQRYLLGREEYVLQVDSHTRFASHWDEQLLAMLGRCASPKPVLTTYPLPYDGAGESIVLSAEARLTILCTRAASDPAFGSDGMLRFRARLLNTPPAAPLPAAFWAAGFSFSSSALVREVPYDPHLPFLFFGEEISIALRMWTRGWDLFAPDRHLVYHKWTRTARKGTFWEVAGGAQLKRHAQARVRRLLTAAPLAESGEAAGAAPSLADTDTDADADTDAQPPPLSATLAEALASAPDAADPIWGVGDVRSLAWYEEYSGVDFGRMQVSAQAERGGMPDEASFWDRFASLDAWLEARELPHDPDE